MSVKGTLTYDEKVIQAKGFSLELNALAVLRDYLFELENDVIYSTAMKYIADDMDIISNTLGLTKEAIVSAEAKCTPLMDLLGIDFLAEYNGKRYAIDVTTASRRATIKVKKEKLKRRLAFFKALDLTPVILRSTNTFLPENIFDYFEQASDESGVIDCRIIFDCTLNRNNLRMFDKYRYTYDIETFLTERAGIEYDVMASTFLDMAREDRTDKGFDSMKLIYDPAIARQFLEGSILRYGHNIYSVVVSSNASPFYGPDYDLLYSKSGILTEMGITPVLFKTSNGLLPHNAMDLIEERLEDEDMVKVVMYGTFAGEILN